MSLTFNQSEIIATLQRKYFIRGYDKKIQNVRIPIRSTTQIITTMDVIIVIITTNYTFMNKVFILKDLKLHFV